MKKILILCLLVLPLACAKTNKDESSQADKKNNNSVLDQATGETGLDFECDGEGEEFTGRYSFKITSVKAKCSNSKNEIQIPDINNQYSCIQRDIEFVCEDKSSAGGKTSGCITKAGKFKLFNNVDDNYFSKAGFSTQGTNIEGKAFMVGTINNADGKLQIATTSKKDGQEKKCIITGVLEAQQSSGNE